MRGRLRQLDADHTALMVGNAARFTRLAAAHDLIRAAVAGLRSTKQTQALNDLVQGLPRSLAEMES